MDKYWTIKKPAEGFHKAKGSKFHGYAWSVYSEEEVKQCLQKLKELHPKARHHCYAWRLGLSDDHYRVNDAGEPSGTAGKPIYGQIRSNDLRNILIVVVRYFGGTKLGVPGLISAYKLTAEETINQAVRIEKNVLDYFRIHFDYSQMNTVMSVMKRSDVQIIEQNFEEACQIRFSIKQADRESLILVLDKIEGLKYVHLYTA